MTKKSSGIQNFFDSCEDYCEPIGYATFQWSAKGCGFGSVKFHVEDGILKCDNEMMSKQFIKDILCKMVDECEMDIPNKKDIK